MAKWSPHSDPACVALLQFPKIREPPAHYTDCIEEPSSACSHPSSRLAVTAASISSRVSSPSKSSGLVPPRPSPAPPGRLPPSRLAPAPDSYAAGAGSALSITHPPLSIFHFNGQWIMANGQWPPHNSEPAKFHTAPVVLRYVCPNEYPARRPPPCLP